MKNLNSALSIIIICIFFLLTGCSPRPGKVAVKADGAKISLEFDGYLHSRIVSRVNGNDLPMGNFNPTEYIVADGKKYQDFILNDQSVATVNNKLGSGKKYIITGTESDLTKKMTITSYDDFPTMLFMQVEYTNIGQNNLKVESWTNNNYLINAIPRQDKKPLFWSYEPGSYGWDHYWVQPLKPGFELDNYLGMNRVDYGGGTPVADIWRQDAGLAVGHVEMVPKQVSLPVSMKTELEASIAVTYRKTVNLKPGDTLATFTTFAAVHKGDHFQTLSEYRRLMIRQGIEFRDAPRSAYETIWCAWGYEKDFTMDEFYGTFPMVQKLGIDWIVLDYGWEAAVGDYFPSKTNFPNGEADMKNVVRRIHAIGKKAQLWWMPLSAHPLTEMFQKHPEYLLLNSDRSPVYIDFWRSFFLCPGSKDVQELTRNFVIKAMKDWGFDGLKIDGNNLNNVPACYNRRHKHAYPEESVEKLPELYKIIYETALSINPNAVIEICPCGTTQSFFIMPYMNQTVSSDPSDSWHIRLKGKTIKALTGDKTAYFGDHVELSDDKSDFATTVGIGGVIGTKFVWPVGVHMNRESGDVSLTPEKEAIWQKWIKIYNDKMLPFGTYRGELYDIGYDRPETHAIQKEDAMYYAFYDSTYTGKVTLRGLADRNYQVTDYENNKVLGNVRGPDAGLDVSFNRHLLIEVKPE